MTDKTEITHELIKPIKYTPKNSGEEAEGHFVTLIEPNVRQLKTCSILKQAFMRVIAKESNETGAEDVASVETDSVPMENRIINALYTSDVDMAVILLSAKELFKDVGLIEGEKKLTVPMLDSMSIADIEMMAGKYMANFILASVLEDQ